jgi:hypothetical protein
MFIKKTSVKNISDEFQVFKKSLDQINFNTEFIVISFSYIKDNELNIKLLKDIYLDPDELNENDLLITLTLDEAKKELSYGFNEFDDRKMRTKKINLELEQLFWLKIEEHINVSNSKIYTTNLYAGYSQWRIFWIIIDEEAKKGFLIAAGAYD